MRLRRLHLERFGCFTDKQYDFGPKPTTGADFHIVFGPNETGKTTTMEGYLRLLFGFAHQEKYAHDHERRNLRVSGAIDVDGETRGLTRLPTRENALRDDDDRIVPEIWLRTHLHGLSMAGYRDLFSLDDETIEAGGRNIVDAKGDVAATLFSATAGLPQIVKQLGALRDEAAELHKKSGQKTRIAALRKQLQDDEARIREIAVDDPEWRRRKATRDQAAAAKADLEAQLVAARTANEKLDAQRRALPLLRKRDDDQNTYAPLRDYPVIDDETRAAFSVAAETKAATAADNSARLGGEIKSRQEEQAALTIDDRLRSLGDRLAGLEGVKAAAITAKSDLPRRRDEQADTRYAIERAAAVFGLDADALSIPALASERISALETLQTAARQAHEKREAAQSAADDAARAHERARDALAARRRAAPAFAGFADTLAFFDLDALVQDRAAAGARLRAADAAIGQARAALDPFGLAPGRAPSPGRSGPDAQADADAHRRLTDKRAEATERRDAIAAEIRSIDAECGPADAPNDEGVAAARAARDAAVDRHLAAPTADSAAALKPAIAEADRCADRRQNRAQEIARIADARRRRAAHVDDAAQADAAIARLDAEIARIDEAIAADCAAQGVAGMTPARFARFCVARDALRDAETKRAGQVLEDAEIAARMVEFEARLGAHKPDGAVDKTLFDAVRAMIADDHAHQAALRAAKEAMTAAQKTAEQAAVAVADANDACADSDARFRDAVADQFGPGVGLTLTTDLAPLHELGRVMGADAGLRRRIDAMLRNENQFRTEITALAHAYGVDAVDPFEAMDRFGAAARATQLAIGRQATLEDEIAERTAARAAHDEIVAAFRTLTARIAARFPSHLVLDTPDALRAAIAKADAAARLREAIAGADRDLCALLNVDDVAAARAALSGLDPAAVDARRETAEAEIDRLNAAWTAAVEAHANAQRDLTEIGDDDRHARLQDRRAATLTEMADVARRHLTLDIAATLVEAAIQRYRATHRSEMLKAAETAFARLTRGGYARLQTQQTDKGEALVAIDNQGRSLRADDLSKGARHQLYLALRLAAYENLGADRANPPFLCDDVFETFDDARTEAACRLMETIGRTGQAIYFTHHRHVVEIATKVCTSPPRVHRLD